MAVYTKLDKEKLNAILSNYNLGEIKRFSEIKEGIENTNYLILFDGKIINNNEKETNFFKFSKTEVNLSKFETKTTTHPKIQIT